MSRAKRFLSNIEFPEMTAFPANPNLGRMVFISGVLYIYAELGGFATWFPLNRPQTSYVHTQGMASNIWNIYHGMGSGQVIIAIYDNLHNIVDASVRHLQNAENVWYTEAAFATPTAGYAVVFGTENLSAPVMSTETMNVSGSLTVDDQEVIVDTQLAEVLDMLETTIAPYTA